MHDRKHHYRVQNVKSKKGHAGSFKPEERYAYPHQPHMDSICRQLRPEKDLPFPFGKKNETHRPGNNPEEDPEDLPS